MEILAPCAGYNYGDETDGLLNETMNALESFNCEEALASLIKAEVI